MNVLAKGGPSLRSPFQGFTLRLWIPLWTNTQSPGQQRIAPLIDLLPWSSATVLLLSSLTLLLQLRIMLLFGPVSWSMRWTQKKWRNLQVVVIVRHVLTAVPSSALCSQTFSVRIGIHYQLLGKVFELALRSEAPFHDLSV